MLQQGRGAADTDLGEMWESAAYTTAGSVFGIYISNTLAAAVPALGTGAFIVGWSVGFNLGYTAYILKSRVFKKYGADDDDDDGLEEAALYYSEKEISCKKNITAKRSSKSEKQNKEKANSKPSYDWKISSSCSDISENKSYEHKKTLYDALDDGPDSYRNEPSHYNKGILDYFF